MSCGFGSPSAMTSPFSTCSPSNTLRCRHFGINSSYLSVPSLVMIKRRLPLVSLPKLTVPLRSARIAESFGLRASNKSATRGKPPVMSRVFDDSRGIRAMNSAPRSRHIRRGNIGIGERDFLALGIGQAHDRTQVLAARAALLRIQHHGAGEAGDIVHLTCDGDAVDEVGELDHAGHFRDHRVRM